MARWQELARSRRVLLLLIGYLVVVVCYVLVVRVCTWTQGTSRTIAAAKQGYRPWKKEDFVAVSPTHYSDEVKEKLTDLVRRQAEARDPQLVSVVRSLMNAPSRHMIKVVRRIVETPQSSEILKILKNKRKGFFVEVGALDGERSSNTLFLEQELGWSGLLIEADPYFYTQLIGKSRRSWSINACIGTGQHPNMMNFKESSGGNGQLLNDSAKAHVGEKSIISVPCFALETMLLAINKTNVDYFSLDVEGFELEVLRTIPFDRINISTLSVEYVHGRSGKKEYISFMRGKGYRVHKDIHLHRDEIALFVDDYIFVKENCIGCTS